MSSQTSPPSAEQALGSSSQPPQTSPQALSSGAGTQSGPAGQSTLVPTPQSTAALGNTTDGVERSAKRSFGDLRRDASRSSKRSNREAANEKSVEAPPPLGTQISSQQKPKKKSFLSFLSCCSGPDDGQGPDSTESAQPSKPLAGAQATRAKQPQQPAQAQNASVTNTSADASKEVIDEKAAHPPAANAIPLMDPAVPAPSSDPEKQMLSQSQAPSLPPQTNSQHVESRTTQGGSQSEPQPESTATRDIPSASATAAALPHLNTSNNALGGSALAAPLLNVTAPTPTLPQQEDEEDMIISDRTPEQLQRDTDIEMTDAGPSLPLSAAEVPTVLHEESNSHDRRESNGSNRIDLPPPPPLKERQAQVAGPAVAGAAGAGIFAAGATAVASQQSSAHESLVSTPDQSQRWLLPPITPQFKGRKCLVLDLDETLVHSSFKILHQADFTIPVEIEGQYHNVYVIKRPGVDAFLKRVGEIYEVVVFTASVSKYGDPLLDILDVSKSVHHRLFRESCYNHQGNYVKDLSQVGRPLEETIIIDNSPTSYIFHPQHAVPISSWFSDAHDNELPDLVPFLEDLAKENVRDVSLILDVAL